MPLPKNRLASLRGAAGLSRVKLSREFDCDPSTIQRWESGQHPIPDEVKLKLASRFGVSVGHLMGWDEDEHNGNGDTKVKAAA